ncbi:hypothetical protein HK096_011159, partial [Nowakowskiella sp. JEL0078]
MENIFEKPNSSPINSNPIINNVLDLDFQRTTFINQLPPLQTVSNSQYLQDSKIGQIHNLPFPLSGSPVSSSSSSERNSPTPSDNNPQTLTKARDIIAKLEAEMVDMKGIYERRIARLRVRSAKGRAEAAIK